jgi:hypothetical protein
VERIAAELDPKGVPGGSAPPLFFRTLRDFLRVLPGTAQRFWILVIAAGAVLPSFPGFLRYQRLRTTASALASMVRYAGDWSVAHEQAVVLVYDEEERRVTLSVDDQAPAEEALAVPVPANETATVEETEAAPPAIDPAYAGIDQFAFQNMNKFLTRMDLHDVG